MQKEEKLKVLKSLELLSNIPERILNALADFLRPKTVEAGVTVFEEDSWGLSLYLVAKGQIRISKRAGAGGAKDVAILGAGEFFGETALVEEVPRTASAIALGPCLLFELYRGDLDRWVKTNPQQAVHFFAELLQVQSRRLRRTSGELALFLDIFPLLSDPKLKAQDFLAQALDRIVPSLEGGWSAAAYLSESGGTMSKVANRGSFDFESVQAPPDGEARDGWTANATYRAYIPGPKGTLACALFHSTGRLSEDERAAKARTLGSMAKFMISALEIIGSK